MCEVQSAVHGVSVGGVSQTSGDGVGGGGQGRPDSTAGGAVHQQPSADPRDSQQVPRRPSHPLPAGPLFRAVYVGDFHMDSSVHIALCYKKI